MTVGKNFAEVFCGKGIIFERFVRGTEQRTRKTYIKNVTHDVNLIINIGGRLLRLQDCLAFKPGHLKCVKHKK
jgi:hypothetical protein